jgi:DNA primase
MAGLISPATLEQIRSASDIVDVIGASVPLKRAGASFVALCPFHKEKTPSFHVNPHKQIFYCFGCHKGGDVFTFVKEYENLPFMDAVRRLAERAKIPIELDHEPAHEQGRRIKDQLLQIHEQITQRWQNALANEAAGQGARDYLAQRGVSAEAMKLFRLGCAPDAWDDTVNWGRSKGHDPVLLEQAGLILRKEGGDHYYDRFRGRLIFPVCDEQGRVIGFSGRVLDADAKTAKYVNSPETPIFTKGKVFFGLDKSKRALLDKEEAIICEGQLDLIACYTAGITNVVAPQGTALTAEHARILKRHVDLVVVCFDADPAGWNATIRSLDSLLEAGLLVLVAVVPAPHDPDSFIKDFGGKAFEKVIQEAENFFDFYLGRLCSTHDITTDKGRLGVLKGMLDVLEKVHKNNRVLWDTYAQKTALRLGVSADAVRVEFKKATRSKAGTTAAPGSEADESAPLLLRAATPEYWLLKLLTHSDENLNWAVRHLEPAWIEHGLVRELVSSAFTAVQKGAWPGVQSWLVAFEGTPAQQIISQVLVDERTLPNVEQNLAGLVLRLRNQFIDRQLAQLRHRSALPELTDAERVELLRKQETLRKVKPQPLTPLTHPTAKNA